MEELHEAENQAKRSPGGKEYLYALIRCAEWVPQPYRDIAKEYSGEVEILKAIYLCACDGVPEDKAKEALSRKQPEAALQALRQKHIEELAIGESGQRLDKLVKKAAALEREVKAVSQTIGQLADHMEKEQAIFPEDVPPEGQGYPNVSLPPQAGQPRGAEEKPPVRPDTAGIDGDVPESGTPETPESVQKKKWRRNRKARKRHTPDLPEYIGSLLDGGYDDAQIGYLLDCIEDGKTPEEIERFASPRLPVEVMQRLRAMNEKWKGKEKEEN